MNNRVKIITAIVVLVITMGAIAAFLFGNKSPQVLESNKTTQTETQTSVETPKSITDLMAIKSSQTCTFSDVNGNSGSVYSANGRVRGDFQSQVDNKSTLSHMVSDGKDFYMWVDGENTGFKGNIESMTKMSQQATTQTTQPFNPEQKVDYKCQGWSVDESQFTVPANIKFADYSEMMKALPSGMMSSESDSIDTKAMQCKACNDLSPEAQAQCKKALSC